MNIERRGSERVASEIDAIYQVHDMFHKGEFKCRVTDISDEGLGLELETESGPMGIKAKGGVHTGSKINILVDDLKIPVKIIYVEMSGAGATFENADEEDIKTLKDKMIHG